MNVELRPCSLQGWTLCDGDCEKCRTFATTETVYNRYTDTAGNYHWTGAYSGEHIVRMGRYERGEKMADVKYPNGTTGDSKSYTVTNNSSEYSTARNLYYEQSDRDYVAVVRCKDCKYHKLVDWGMGNCEYPNGFKWIAYDNDFCSRGEKKEDANS